MSYNIESTGERHDMLADVGANVSPEQRDDAVHLADLAVSKPDPEDVCLNCESEMSRPEPELEPTPLCHLCAQAALPKLAAEVKRLRAAAEVKDGQRSLLIKAIRRFTVEAADDEPNGEAEQAIDDLLAAIEQIQPWAQRDTSMRFRVRRISEAGKRLVAALADDTQALREAAEACFGGDFRATEATR